jgi:hypothetical protein
MFVTSTPKVTVPGILALLEVCTHDHRRLTQLSVGQADVYRQMHVGLEPELPLPVRMRGLHMNSCLLAGKEEETKRAITNDGRRPSAAF